jgi:transcriptional regulator with XRE-family HTH domain
MRPTLRRMTLPELLQRHGIYTIRDLSRRTGLSSQQAWNLWHGVAGLGRRTMQRLHEKLGIPAEELLQVTPPPPKPKAPRPDHFGGEDGDITITDPPEEEP